MQIRAPKSKSAEPAERPRPRDWYASLRGRYQPDELKLVLLAESPPASGRYFYDPQGSVNEPLFLAIMRCLGREPLTKDAGLRDLQKAGWMLVDATYEPVNALGSASRSDVILRDYPSLCQDLLALTPDRRVPVILIKANICRLLEPRLTEAGFNVLNNGQTVYFPSHGRQAEFRRQIALVLEALRSG